MTDLNLQIIYNGETEFMNIQKTSSMKFLCNMIREIFKKANPDLNNKKLVIFNGIPPKKIFEHDTDPKITLEELKIYNNSILRFDIDEENYISEDYLNSSDNIKKQQEAFDKLSSKNNSLNKIENNDSLKINESDYMKNISGNDSQEKKEEGIFYFNYSVD